MVPAVAALAKVLVVVRVLVLVDRRAPPRREDVAVLVEAGTARVAANKAAGPGELYVTRSRN